MSPQVGSLEVVKPDQPVSSFNEWDPLEEVIVGNIDGAMVPPFDKAVESTLPEEHFDLFKSRGGTPFPPELVEAARRNLDEFAHVLEAEGISVRRPARVDFSKAMKTPDFSVASGLYAAMPRDLLLVIGDELIEAPMAWRSRYYEMNAYRPLLKEYFRRGARWSAAPKPQLADELYDSQWRSPSEDGPMRYVLTEFEPTFDAADFTRCGRDIFYQRSNTTNEFGVRWLEQHLGSNYRLHQVHVRDTHPMHIDASFVPLAPGKLLINPERVPHVPAMFRSWDVLVAPKPWIPDSIPLFMSSRWLTMNVLMLDQERVMVERHDEVMIKAFKDWGFKPVLCNFLDFMKFGGAFHCATLDVKRRGTLQSYF
jgi:glycine amidinotransferase